MSRRAASAEDTRKDVFETAAAATRLSRPRAFEHVGEIKSSEVERNLLACGSGLSRRHTAAGGKATGTGASIGLGRRRINIVGVKANLIVNLALLGIAQDIIGFGDGLKLLLSSLVAWVDVRMILTRQLTKSFTDVVGGSRLLYAEDLVIVFFGSSGHLYWIFRLPFLNVSAHSCLAASTYTGKRSTPFSVVWKT